MIDIRILRQAGLSDAQILRVLDLAHREYLGKIREQNRQRQKRYRQNKALVTQSNVNNDRPRDNRYTTNGRSGNGHAKKSYDRQRTESLADYCDRIGPEIASTENRGEPDHDV